MKKTVITISQLPKWYGIGIVLLYGVLFAEFFSSVNQLLFHASISNNIVKAIIQLHYGLSILSGIIIWIFTSLIFHLTALLFNGQATFKQFLFASAYPYLLPIWMLIAGIFILNGIQIDGVEGVEDVVMMLENNFSFRLAVNLVNFSFIPCYIMIAILIHHIHKVSYLYAGLSVLIPVFSIWGIAQLFRFV